MPVSRPTLPLMLHKKQLYRHRAGCLTGLHTSGVSPAYLACRHGQRWCSPTRRLPMDASPASSCRQQTLSALPGCCVLLPVATCSYSESHANPVPQSRACKVTPPAL